MAQLFIGRRDLRYSDFQARVHAGFTGLMYALCYNTLDVVVLLMDHEAMLDVEREACVRTPLGTFLLQPGLTPLHMAAVCSAQPVIDAFAAYYRSHATPIVRCPSVSRYLALFGKRVDAPQLREDLLVDQELLRLSVQFARIDYLNAIAATCFAERDFDDLFPVLAKQLLLRFTLKGAERTV